MEDHVSVCCDLRDRSTVSVQVPDIPRIRTNKIGKTGKKEGFFYGKPRESQNTERVYDARTFKRKVYKCNGEDRGRRIRSQGRIQASPRISCFALSSLILVLRSFDRKFSKFKNSHTSRRKGMTLFWGIYK